MKPSNPIADQAASVSASASAAAIPAAANRRVAASQTTSGQRKSFNEIAAARALPEAHRRSRHRHAIARSNASRGVSVPSLTAEMTGGDTTTIATNRQSRTPRIQSAARNDAINTALHTAAAV